MRYGILGVTEVRGEDGELLPLGGARLRALLAALALRADRTVGAELLIDEVWADDPPGDAPAALQALVGRLRRVLGRDAVLLEPGGYRLAVPREHVDLFAFERLAAEGGTALERDEAGRAAQLLGQALALWRGPALDDLPDRGAGARAEAQRLEAVRSRAEAELRLGGAAGLVPELRELTTAHPYDEQLHALLLRALRDAGRRADALAAYEQARRTLDEGLGTEPGPELRSLHAELLTTAPGAAGRGAQQPYGAARSAQPAEYGSPGPVADPRDAAAHDPEPYPTDPHPTAPAGDPRPQEQRDLRRKAPGPRGEEPHPRPDEGDARRQERDPQRDERNPRPQQPEPYPAELHPAELHPTELRPGEAHFGTDLSRDGHPPRTSPHPPQADAPPHTPSAARQGNLRPRLTSFVGREAELDAIQDDLGRSRLVTLIGPGGSGKTRLAEEAAARYPRSWIAELAPLDHPEAVPGAVVTALGLRETMLRRGGETHPVQEDPLTILVEHCAGRELLLILDNCEHLIAAAAELSEALLTRCPGLTVLATSREPLGVPGELVRPVEPLPPDPALRLFTERATAVRPDFDPEREAAAVAEICRRLDGLPLAIELAAARLRLLTPRQIADRLDDRFRLLTSGSRTVLPRQQTLRAVVDWSWDLLDEQERTVLCEVAVFAGGWDLPGAEAVCSGPAADLIGALVDKSLVVAGPVGSGGEGGMRYRLLETIHEYATERAAAYPGLRAAAERRHAAYFLALAQRADSQLRTGGQLPWIQRLESELDNIRAALDRAAEAGEEETACRLALTMSWFWWLRNYRGEGIEWISLALGLGERDGLSEGDGLGERDGGGDGDGHGDGDGARDGGGDLGSKAPEDAGAQGLVPSPEEEAHPLFWTRMYLRLQQFLLISETRGTNVFTEEPRRTQLARLRAAFDRPVPQAAVFPGTIWPFTVFMLEGSGALTEAMDRALANCRRHGTDWDIGVTLMFRTHLAVDRPGGMREIDANLAELRELGPRVGDRWMRAQVCSAAGETAMARGHLDEAAHEYQEALRHASEVGAHAESPFLRARLAETAFRGGDRASALEILKEASDESERYAVPDARAFVRFLHAVIALSDGNLALAREQAEAAGVESARSSPPPQFHAAMQGLEARLVAAESGAGAGLPLLVEALRYALASNCADLVVASLLDSGAWLLGELGEHARAARLQGAGGQRRGVPRTEPELGEARHVREHGEAALGVEGFVRELSRGFTLTEDAFLAELTAVTGT
ncbi:AfsR/SARP family transcriptional regulator [Streptomyces sp. SCSIO ZS0520]|uniref:AfsR/SARP family transcriptional regulator n=1 Tax=Streptomyces sp. SCSIO ZS0520 TaxID=2892996 RepID=UPI0021D86567|nr:BTAD domain-containing putative transcriptional regulator [Streptomyces sp. SCSIO ZS0520]